MANELNNINAFQIKTATDAIRENGSFMFNGLEIEVQRVIPVNAVIRLIQEIVKGCFDLETNEYKPEYKDFLIRVGITSMFTNIELPELTEERFEVLYGTSLFSQILSLIDAELLDMIFESIDRKIAHQASANINALQIQVENVAVKFESMVDAMNDLFGEINKEDIDQIKSVFANGMFDEGNLVKAIAAQKVAVK